MDAIQLGIPRMQGVAGILLRLSVDSTYDCVACNSDGKEKKD